MELDDDEIESFKQAWRDDFGETISFETARSELNRLLMFFQILYDAFYGPDRPDSRDGASCDTMAP